MKGSIFHERPDEAAASLTTVAETLRLAADQISIAAARLRARDFDEFKPKFTEALVTVRDALLSANAILNDENGAS
jgi:hypothetical protein